MKTPAELMALPTSEAHAYIEALTDKEKVTLRNDVVDWLVDELGFVITRALKEVKDETFETSSIG